MIKLVPSLFYREAETKEALCRFIARTTQLSIGPECEKFEEAFSRYQERTHCVLFHSGSSANLALVQALLNLGTLQQGAEVGFSAMTWATNVMPLIQLGLAPVPIDVEVDTLNVSSRTLADALVRHPRMRALFLTDLLGFCDDLETIRRVCDERNILLLEDACEALGTVYRGRRLGNWGLAGTFSFFVGHHLSTIEGGAVCTDDAALDRMLRLVRAHGWDRNLADEERAKIRAEYHVQNDFFANFTFYALGYNLRPTEITGFLGNSQLAYLETIVARRQEQFRVFAAGMRHNADVYPLRTEHLDVVSAFAIPVICRSASLARQYVKRFTRAEVEIRPIVGGAITEQPFFRALFPRADSMPNAGLINSQGFYFGNHPELTEPEIGLLQQLLVSETVLAEPSPVPSQVSSPAGSTDFRRSS